MSCGEPHPNPPTGSVGMVAAEFEISRLQEANASLTRKLATAIQHFKENASHDSWRCSYYPECHCGLWEVCDEMGIERIELPPKPK